MTAAGRGGPARRARAAGGGQRTAMRVIVLATLVHMLRSRRFYARVITVVVAVRALGQIGKENEASTMARLAAWDKRQVERVQRKAKSQGRAVKGTVQMARSGAPRDLAAKMNRT
jgi:hypothetical protein